MTVRRLAAAAAAAGALAAAAPAAAHADAPAWVPAQPAPPAGSPFPTPLGSVADLQFYAPNRGLLITGGTATVAKGLYVYDGSGWRSYATVCGSATGRIAWAGADEFWTVSDPAIPTATGEAALTLCHFNGGTVTGSYAVPDGIADAYTRMTGAACASPTDCWFAGDARTAANGAHTGTFHLHWDGARIAIVDGPAGRGATSLATSAGKVYETLAQGARFDGGAAAINAPSGAPALLQTLTAAAGQAPDAYQPRPVPDVAAGDTELLSASSDGTQLWVGGGGASSGPQYGDDPAPRPPLLARGVAGGAVADVPLRTLPDGTALSETAVFDHVAAIPGTDQAWAALDEHDEAGNIQARARLVRVAADGTILEDVRLPGDGQVLGAIESITCTGPTDCWAATVRGWLFHWTDGTPQAQDTDPAFTRLVTQRPADGRTPVFTPDTLPVDDSLLYAPPSDAALPAPILAEDDGTPTTLKALLARIRSKLLKHNVLRVSFTLRRTARVGLVASRRGKTVARAKVRTLRPGRRALQLKLNKKHWPTKLRFQTRELDRRLTSGTSGTTTDASGSTSTPASTTAPAATTVPGA
jgi:hypothetical protein